MLDRWMDSAFEFQVGRRGKDGGENVGLSSQSGCERKRCLSQGFSSSLFILRTETKD